LRSGVSLGPNEPGKIAGNQNATMTLSQRRGTRQFATRHGELSLFDTHYNLPQLSRRERLDCADYGIRLVSELDLARSSLSPA
jgi:hypothetical protein